MNNDAREGVFLGLSGLTLLLIVAAMVVGIVVVGWAVGGWFQVQNAKRQGTINNIQAHNYRSGYDYQQTLRSSITSDLKDVTDETTQMSGETSQAQVQATGAHRYAVVEQICQEAENVTGDPLPADQAQFVRTNCSRGAVKSSSEYAPRS